MQEASASVKDGGGTGIPLPLPHNSLSYTSISNNISNKPIPVSFPPKQFEHFERAIQEVNNTLSSMSDDCVITNTMSSPNVSLHNNSITSSRSHLPSLINTNVQDFSDFNILMEIEIETENASRKRALPLSTSEIQESTKPKKTSNDVNTILRDSLSNP